MCGFLGVVGARNSSISVGAIRDATRTLRHRGPDDEGYLFFDASTRTTTEASGQDTNPRLRLETSVDRYGGHFNVAFAHRRLSILDVSEAGHQPMPSQDRRFWIMLNGEIYNFVELRQLLSRVGYTFRTQTDTEVLLAAYEEWGAEMFSRLVGMFAIAILDTISRTVLLARDPFGIKPLYYSTTRNPSISRNADFVFASEITPILSFGGSTRRADVDAIYRYMRLGVTDGQPTTMFEGVKQLPAAHYGFLELDRPHQFSPRPYWVPGAVAQRTIKRADAVAELRVLFDESIRLHLRSDVPLGVCLSGGLDSTAIVASMRRQLGRDARIHSFSFVSDDPRTGEGPYVSLAVKAFDLEGHIVSPTETDLANDLAALVRAQEQPFGSTSIYAQYAVFRLAHEARMTVMLDGQGADELFGGYATAVSAQLSASILRGNLREAKSLALSSHISAATTRRRMILSSAGRLFGRRLLAPFIALVGESLYPSWLNAKWFRSRGYIAEQRPQGRGRRGLTEELLHFVKTLSLPQLLRYEDRNSMAFSIESRVPFCTVALADFAFSLPPSLLVSPRGETKSVLRDAVVDSVPAEIIARPKIGFETPERAWLRSLRPWMRQLIASEEFRSLPFLEHQSIENMIGAPLEADWLFPPMLWRALNISLWATAFGVTFE